MDIRLSGEDLEHLEFKVEQTSDRQDQPERLCDKKPFANALDNDRNWMNYRWDMFFIDVTLSTSHLKHDIGVYVEREGKPLYYYDTWIRMARFFVEPNLQYPTQFKLSRQPSALTPEAMDIVEEAAKKWFLSQPEYLQQVRWVLSAMHKMRTVLVLAGKFNVEWWSMHQDGVTVAEEVLANKGV